MYMKKPLVSIIIPVIKINDYIMESVPKNLELDWPDFEIIIFADEADESHHFPKTRIIASGKVGPAEKRDLALKYAKGEYLAFLDDDAYPQKNWLKKAMIHFETDDKLAAVGGPAVTPESDGVLQKVSGAVFESYLGGASARNRYLSVGPKMEVDDWPTVNLIVRRDVFEKIGGFDNSFWPGEDTKLCLDIINAGYKIIYEPDAIVFHHRRSDMLKHFKQVGNYALHRGYFAKIYPKTSRKLFYFVPSLFDLYLIVLITLSFVHNPGLIGQFIAFPIIGYFLFLIVDGIIISWRWQNSIVGFLSIILIFLTHLWYGIRFVQGLIVPKLLR